MTTEQLISRIKDITKNLFYINNDGGIEIYCDYNDELSDTTIKNIMESNNPMDTFKDILSEWATDYTLEYSKTELEKDIKNKLSDEELECWNENKDDIENYINDNYYFYYPENHFNKNVKVNIMIDCGNMNSDFTQDNVLNWYGTDGGYGNNGDFNKYSSILWLAETQNKATQLRNQTKKVYNSIMNDMYSTQPINLHDKFIESCIQEMENLPSHMSSITFLVSMPLFDLFTLKNAMALEKPLNKSYTPEQRTGTSYIVIDKSVMCGLYDPWQGSGSILEIELDQDVKLPLKYIYNAWIDGTKPYSYDIGDVYGMHSSAWRECLKETHYNMEV